MMDVIIFEVPALAAYKYVKYWSRIKEIPQIGYISEQSWSKCWALGHIYSTTYHMDILQLGNGNFTSEKIVYA